MTAQDPVTPADATLAGFLQSIALAVADVYDKVTPLLSDTAKPIATTFQNHHKEHALALAAQAGTATATLPNQALTLVLAAPAPGGGRRARRAGLRVRSRAPGQRDVRIRPRRAHESRRHSSRRHDPHGRVGHAGVLGSSAGLTAAALFPNGALHGAAVGDGSDTTLGFDPASFPVS